MKAIILTDAGSADKLEMTDLPKPEINDRQVLIQSKAISVNPVDAKVRIGKSLYNELRSQNPFIIPGWDVSGVIVETGKSVTEFKPGDEVFGMVNFPGHGKAYAEFVAAPIEHIALKPGTITHEEAAAATLAALTAWQALVTNAKVSNGQKIVIQAASGGVGHYAVQIGKFLGAYVIATSSIDNKDFTMSLGADEHIDYKKHPIDTVVTDADFVLDPIGGENIDPSLNAVKKGGTVIMLPSFFKEEIRVKASAKGVNGYYFTVKSSGDDMRQLATLLENGIVRSHVSKRFSFDQMKDAHLQIESGRTVGKIVVTL
jgi:NADPH:quinone reductase-like Zn-dependent oxidoreductase